MRTILIILLLIVSFGCAKSVVEKTNEAVDVALTYLSDNKCEDAIKILTEAGPRPGNAVYLQVLASAYACRAKFDEIRFVDVDLTAINTTSLFTIVKSLASMTTSPEAVADSVAYTSISQGMNVIVNSTSGSPSHLARVAKFGPRKAGDMSVQALILGLVNLGKFFRFYGNTNTIGVKGAGPGGNSCFINYSDPRASLLISSGNTGACSSPSNGHPDIDLSAPSGRRRLCEPIVALNNSIDILENIDLTNSSTLSKLGAVASKINQLKTIASAAGLAGVTALTSQSGCEAFAEIPTQLLDLEYFTGLIFEASLL